MCPAHGLRLNVHAVENHFFIVNLTSMLNIFTISLTSKIVRPVAQLVERWTPGSECPGSRRSGDRYTYETPDWDGPVGGSNRGQLKSVEWDGPCLALMGTLNFRF